MGDATLQAGTLQRLLVITYYFPPHVAVGGLRWAGITKHLARLGWEVAIVTAVAPDGNGTPRGVRVESCARRGTLFDAARLLRRLILGAALGRSPTSRGARQAGPPGPLRQLGREVAAFLTFPDESRGWMLRAAWRTRRLVRAFQPQVVVSSGPPHAAHLVAGIATIGSPVRWFVDLRDPWGGPLPEILRSHPRFGTRVFRTLAPRLERLAFRFADGVITNTHQLAAVLRARYPEVSVACVPNGVDPERLPSPAPHPYPGLGIAYAGSMYAGRDFGPVVRALGIFFERHPEAARAGSKLRVVGEIGPDHARAFHDVVAAVGIPQHVEVLGPLPRGQALEVVSRSRLAVVLAQQQELQIPAKLYESVAMGITTLVVAPADSAAGIEGTRLGALVRDADDVEGIACVLEHLWRDGFQPRSPCAAPITYDVIAPLADQLLRHALNNPTTAGS